MKNLKIYALCCLCLLLFGEYKIIDKAYPLEINPFCQEHTLTDFKLQINFPFKFKCEKQQIRRSNDWTRPTISYSITPRQKTIKNKLEINLGVQTFRIKSFDDLEGVYSHYIHSKKDVATSKGGTRFYELKSLKPNTKHFLIVSKINAPEDRDYFFYMSVIFSDNLVDEKDFVSWWVNSKIERLSFGW